MKNTCEVFPGRFVVVFLRTKKDGPQKAMLIDECDLERTLALGYSIFACGQKKTRKPCAAFHETVDGKQKTIWFHRWLMDAPAGVLVDHLNGNTLDNRRTNLRLATNVQNNLNIHGATGRSRSGIRGVSPYGKSGKYRARIGIGNRTVCLGTFRNIEDARRAFNEKLHEIDPLARTA